MRHEKKDNYQNFLDRLAYANKAWDDYFANLSDPVDRDTMTWLMERCNQAQKDLWYFEEHGRAPHRMPVII